MTAKTYSPASPIWCAGCGHFGVQAALKTALHQLGVASHETLILAGIGCSGTIQNNLGTYGYHAMHGRVLPTATGAALANPGLSVIAAGGDGDGYAIGAGHLVHCFRRNLPLVYILMNNHTYGLTKGQHSPTRPYRYPTHQEPALDGITLGLSIRATSFLARGYTGNYPQLVSLTAAAIEHARARRGFAFLEVISPCVTYHDTYPQWDRRLENLDENPDHDPGDRVQAFAHTQRLAAEGRLPSGLILSDPQPPPPAPLPPSAPTGVLPRAAARYRIEPVGSGAGD